MTSITAKMEVMLEYSNMGQPSHCPLGMYVMPFEDDIFQWDCVLFIHKGYYASSVLRFTLSIPQTYPSTAPRILFSHPPPFHPLIDPISGDMHLGRLKHWRARADFITNLLHYVKAAFKRRQLDDVREAESRNREAWRLYRDQTTLFAKLALQTAQLSTNASSLYAAQPAEERMINFRKLMEGEEETLKEGLEEEARARLVRS